MAILTGGEVISDKIGLKLENADLALLGRGQLMAINACLEGGVVAEKSAT